MLASLGRRLKDYKGDELPCNRPRCLCGNFFFLSAPTYFRQVAAGSPAECSGLLEGDRIIEVNHSNVEQCQHDKLAALIMALKDEVCLLVVDRETEKLCADRGVSFVDPSHHVKHIMCPHLPPAGGRPLL